MDIDSWVMASLRACALGGTAVRVAVRRGAGACETKRVVGIVVLLATLAFGGVRAARATLASAVDAGDSHTCTVTTAGAVQCWGSNVSGALGNDGAAPGSSTPVSVSGLGSGVAAVSAGQEFACAVTTGGGVQCWGYNFDGQIGDGMQYTNRPTPVEVTGLGNGIKAVSAGEGHACAVTMSGGVKCWGDGQSGALGDGGSGAGYEQDTPVDVVDVGVEFETVSAGSSHTCALTTAGGVKCWGYDYYGALGDGNSGLGTNRSTPGDVIGLASGVKAVSAGRQHTCAVTTGGGVKCWGSNSSGQLGISTNSIGNSRSTPGDVIGLGSGVEAVSAGGEHTCALMTTGGVKCWGRNLNGQVGYDPFGAGTTAATPTQVFGLQSGVEAVSAGYFHTCAVMIGGGVKCWGKNLDGRLGDGTDEDRPTPVDVTGFSCGNGLIESGEVCDGGGCCAADCSALLAAETICRASVGACDMAEVCTSATGAVCPADQQKPDTDADTICDEIDNCAAVTNLDQADDDGDTVGDVCDNCPATCNPDQGNADGDAGGGDVCDACPAIDQSAEPVECAAAAHSSEMACCRDLASEAVSVDADGASCGAASDVSFQTPPDPDTGATVTVGIPSGAVDGPTSISVTPMTQGGSEYILDTAFGKFVTGAIMEPEGTTFDPPLLVCMAWQDADNNGRVDNLDFVVNEVNIRPTLRDEVSGTETVLGPRCGMQTPCGALGVDGLPATVPGTLDDPALAACCSTAANVYCFEVTHFSAYAIADLSCAGEATARIIGTRMNQAAGTQGLQVKGEFDLGGPIPGGLDPQSTGFELVIQAADDTPLYQVTLPAGAYSRATGEGWKPSRRGGSAQWQSKIGIKGVKKVKLAWNDATGQGSFDLKGKGLKLVATPADLPLQAEVRLDPAVLAGRCGAASFAPPGGMCAFNSSGSTLLCQ